MSELFLLAEATQQAHNWKNNPPNGNDTKSMLYATIEHKIVEIALNIGSEYFAFCEQSRNNNIQFH